MWDLKLTELADYGAANGQHKIQINQNCLEETAEIDNNSI